MKRISVLFGLAATAWLAAPATGLAQTATIYGQLGNFDVVNNTGTTASTVTLLFATTPLWAALLARALGWAFVKPLFWVAIAVSASWKSSAGAALFVISDINRLRLTVSVPQNFVPAVKINTKVEITVPDISLTADGPVDLYIAEPRVNPALMEALRGVLASHAGPAEVHLTLVRQDSEIRVRLDEALRVKPSPALFGDLKALLGATCLERPKAVPIA